MAPHSSILAWKIPWTEDPGGLQFLGLRTASHCFLTCIQVSQEPGKVIWYSHLFKNFLQFIVIHTVKGIDIVNKAEINVFWNSFAFLMIQGMLVI